MRISDWSSDVCSADLIVELVPIVGHRVDAAALRTEKVAAKLEIIGRIRKEQIDRVLGQFVHGGDAVALNYHIQRQGVSSHWTPVKQQKSTLNHPESQRNQRIAPVDRSEERSVGKECVNTCRTRGSQKHKK